MKAKTCCLFVCSSSFGLAALVLLVLAIFLGADYSGIDDSVKHQIDEVLYIHRCRYTAASLAASAASLPSQ